MKEGGVCSRHAGNYTVKQFLIFISVREKKVGLPWRR
jgi:hypothetical protein